MTPFTSVATSPTRAEDAVEALLRRDRALGLAGLAVLTALAWMLLLRMDGGGMTMDEGGAPMHVMSDGAGLAGEMARPDVEPWGSGRFPPLFVMWAVMMVAMMLPSAAPVVLLVLGMNRARSAGGRPYVPGAVFLAAYLAVWSLYAALAAAGQIALHDAALLSPAMSAASPLLGGGLLIAAGVFQWTPLKGACLSHCRSPFHVLGTEWREGLAGAIRLGLRHGSYCVGCCWLLMALLFVAGVMNVLWVAALAGLVLIEKAAPRGEWVSRGVGVLMVTWGVYVMLS